MSAQQQQKDDAPSVHSKMELYTTWASAVASSKKSRATTPEEEPASTATKAATRALPKSVQESSLTEFLSNTVSKQYHLQPNKPRNTGGRPLSVAQVNDRLRQRALTLVSGKTTTTTSTRSTLETSRIHGRRVSRKRQREFVSSQKSVEDLWVSPSDQDILLQLHRLWLEYMLSALQQVGPRPNDVEKQVQWLASCAPRVFHKDVDVELVGAYVRVETCHRHCHWQGRVCGIILQDTAETWKLLAAGRKGVAKRAKKGEHRPAVAAPERSDAPADGEPSEPVSSKKEEAHDSRNPEATEAHSSSPIRMTSYVVPKQGSSLAILLPVDGADVEAVDLATFFSNKARQQHVAIVIQDDVSDR